MRDYCISFRSITYGQHGQRVLRQGGINGFLRRTPRWMEEKGCGYCIQVPEVKGVEAVSLLRREGVTFRKVYWLGGNEPREVEL